MSEEDYFIFNYSGDIYTPDLWLNTPTSSEVWGYNLSNDELKNTLYTTILNLTYPFKYQFKVTAIPFNDYQPPSALVVKVSETEVMNVHSGCTGEHLSATFTSLPDETFNMARTLARNELVNPGLDLQRLDLYEITPYALFVDVGNWSHLFLEKTYDSINYTSNLILNTPYLYEVFNANNTAVFYQDPSGAECQGFETGDTRSTLGFRLLELSCLKMFRNARARYAVSNTQDFRETGLQNNYDNQPLYSSIINQIVVALTSTTDVLDHYSSSTNRYNENSSLETFDFTDMNFQLLVAYSSHSQTNIALVHSMYNSCMFEKVRLTLGEFPV